MKSLKIALWIPAIGCLMAVPFIFLPWSVVESISAWFAAEPLPTTPIAVYYFKVVFGIFGLIGVFFVMLARDPLKHGEMLNLAAFGLMTYGLLALIVGFFNGISAAVYIADGLSGTLLGVVILFLSTRLKTRLKP